LAAGAAAGAGAGAWAAAVAANAAAIIATISLFILFPLVVWLVERYFVVKNKTL
jgi:hypothetical protein